MELPWMEIAERFGFPAASFAVLSWMVWKAGRGISIWIGKEFIVPVRERISQFLDDHTHWMRGQQTYLENINNSNIEHHGREEMVWEETAKRFDRIEDYLRMDKGNNHEPGK